jgi:hypothetical protein
MAEFTETLALVAALEGREDEVERLVADMYPRERETFVEGLLLCTLRASHRCLNCDTFIPYDRDGDQDPLGPDERFCERCIDADPLTS